MLIRKTAIASSILSLALLSAPAWSADEVFKAQCAKCHGEDGRGETAVGKAMKVPSLVDAKYAGKSAADLAAAVKANKKHAGVVAKIKPEELEAAAAKVAELNK